ncbi:MULTISPECIES: hypothetical protein [unclassified Pseudoxanthomonas]|uniref:hypothetical protein n=1 Tax=unclassified Pseudoxanthomonas TaxID=2645906 RepID=UPI00307F68BE
MRTDLWGQFGDLIQEAPRLLATVTAHNGDGTSSVTLIDGSTTRVRNQLGGTIPYNVWVQDGKAIETGPNLPLVDLDI